MGCIGRAVTSLRRRQSLEKITTASSNPEFEYHLGVIYSEQHKNEEAIAAFERALKLISTISQPARPGHKLASPGRKGFLQRPLYSDLADDCA